VFSCKVVKAVAANTLILIAVLPEFINKL